MKYKHHVEKGATRKVKKPGKQYKDFFWEIIEEVRNGQYDVTDVNSVVEQKKEKNNNFFNIFKI